MRRTIVLLVIAMTTGLVPAGAHTGSSCGGEWARARTCDLVFEGMPLVVSGTSEAEDPAVRVWITPAGYPEVILLECVGAAACEERLEVDHYPDVALPEQVPRLLLRCYVAGAAPGVYACSSGDAETTP